jgi:GNAT superfamily N-acetyltransferase
MTSARSTVTLREAGLQDVPAIVALQARSWRTAYRGMVDDEFLDAIPMDKWIESWRTHFFGGRGRTRCFVAELDRRIIGFAGAGAAEPADDLDDSVGELHTIYTDEAYYGQGIGQRLMAAALDHLAGSGFSVAILWVLEANQRGRRFYEAGGWKADGAAGADCWGATSVARVRYRRTLG